MDYRDAANRDLLIGLLALQNGLIGRTALVSTFRAWALDKSRPLAELLALEGAIDGDERALLEGLAARHLSRHGGDAEKSIAALGVGQPTLDELATLDDLPREDSPTRVHVAGTEVGGRDAGRDEITTLGNRPMDGSLTKAYVPRTTLDGQDAGRHAAIDIGEPTGNHQRFRILRPHARGGLGAVFVAMDTELHREVALKQILDHHADDPNSRHRFLLEAEITGGLEHPGIVPVYGLGTYHGGRPYYAMRFVQGESFKEAIDHFHQDRSIQDDPGRRSLALRKLLRRFVDVCNVIDYAHSRGVLHRDIKPANVILGKHGETLVVDWGLAKALGHTESLGDAVEQSLVPSSGSGSAGTMQGQALGTPAYMSPEQARGDLDAMGARSDVYSLGASLHYLLTGKSPFVGKVVEVLKAVESGDHRPPRALDPTIDKAMEAICLKAMAREPGGRYASGRGLAEDVERWAADEPVSAYPEPLDRRARRWMRRHGAAVATAAVLLVVAAGTLGVAAWRINQERERADQQRVLAESEFRTSRKVVNEVLVRLADSGLPDVPGMESIRRDLAAEAVHRYEGFLFMHPNDDRLLLEAAQVYRRAANVEQLTSALVAAEKHSRSALEAIDKLIARSPDDIEVRSTWASIAIDAGSLLRKLGKPREAEPLLRRGIERADAPSDPQGRVRSFGLIGLGYLLRETGRRDGALEAFTEAANRLEPFADKPRAEPVDVTLSVMALRNRAGLLRESGELADASSAIEKALGRAREALKRDEKHTDYRTQLACSLQEQGRLLALDPARKDEARLSLDEAVNLEERLVGEYPRTHHYRGDLADALLARGTLFPGDRDDDLVRAGDLLQTLVAEVPSFSLYARQLGLALTSLGQSALRRGRPEEARLAFKRAGETLGRLLKANPDDATARKTLDTLRAEMARPPGG